MPDQLMNIFKKNMNLLLGIFNPEGLFEISYPFNLIIKRNLINNLFKSWFLDSENFGRYLDEDLQVGRDGKGNVFVLEKTEKP